MPAITRAIMASVKKSCGNRKFYALPEDYALKTTKYRPHAVTKKEDTTKLFKYIDDNVIGKNQTFSGPYGRRKVVYCDYTASGRPLQFIEDYILREVLPLYGNTHTTTTITSMQSTLFRHEARDIVRNAVHASEDDAVIFTGHGTTGAVHKLLHALNMSRPPVVFVGPCEHHSNLLPWREVGAKVVRISETKEGFLDLVDLENQLRLQRGAEGSEGSKLIGCFSAASNITGILADDVATTLMLHQYGALAFWDYATAAPYVTLDMNPLLPGVNEKAAYKDAIFFSGHKFVGGVQTPGILVAKKTLFANSVPQGCGGGSVFFVSRNSHRYLKDTELREEGGTGAIVESVRAGLALQLKQTVGVTNIMAREEKITKMFLSHIRNIPELLLLGSPLQGVKRLAVFSMMVRHPRGAFLHHNFVCAVLNDVFGIQARGGCACAGPYAQDLLGIDAELAVEYENVLLEDSRLDRHHLRRHEECSAYEMLRPGFTRLSLPYFMADQEVAFVMEAVKMVATEGWKLLPQYILNPETGEWRHHTNSVFRERKWLGSMRYVDGKMAVTERKVSGIVSCPQDFAECLQTARNTFNKARKMAQRYPLADQCVMFDERTDRLRWFMLPSEAQDLLLGHAHRVKQSVPFDPAEYCGSRGEVVTCTSPPVTGSLFTRHNSLPVLDIKQARAGNREMRPRSDSHSPSRKALSHPSPPPQAQQSMLLMTPSRERCFSLGSTSPLCSTQLLPHQVSCGSQTNLADHSDESISSDVCERGTSTPPIIVTTNQPEHLQAYVQEVTKELATEIKSELREVINQMEDVLSESADSEQNGTHNHHEKRFSVDYKPCQTLQQNAETGVRSTLSVCVNSQNGSNADLSLSPGGHMSPSHSFCHSPGQISYNSPVAGIGCQQSPRLSVSAEHVAEYLAELTTEMVSEMKSEIREMVSAVDEIISPNSEMLKQISPTNLSEMEQVEPQHNGDSDAGDVFCMDDHESALTSIIEGVEDYYPGIRLRDNAKVTVSLSSQDSGINLTDRDSPSEALDQLQRRNSSYENREKCGAKSMERLANGTNVSCQLLRKRPTQEGAVSDTGPTEEAQTNPKARKPKWYCPTKNIWKPMTDAIREFNMIRNGDRVLVCLSGGKDSLSLLHTLHQYQHYLAAKDVQITLGAATVDPGSSAYNPRPLIPYLAALGVHYLYEEQSILDQALETDCKSVCSFCSRMKRGRLYAAARRHGYNVLALGQHLDDLAESFLMSTFHNGRLRSMKAHYNVKERDLRVIRPFVYVREKSLRQFAESRNLPVIPENCPACFEAPKERHRTKQLLAQQEILFPRLFLSLRAALKPLISFHHTGEESRAYERAKIGLQDTDTDMSDEEPAQQ